MLTNTTQKASRIQQNVIPETLQFIFNDFKTFITASAKGIVNELHTLIDVTGRYVVACPSQKTIGRKSGLKLRQSHKHIQTLKTLGLINVYSQGHKKTLVYMLSPIFLIPKYYKIAREYFPELDEHLNKKCVQDLLDIDTYTTISLLGGFQPQKWEPKKGKSYDLIQNLTAALTYTPSKPQTASPYSAFDLEMMKCEQRRLEQQRWLTSIA